jgi:hypothetical protein
MVRVWVSLMRFTSRGIHDGTHTEVTDEEEDIQFVLVRLQMQETSNKRIADYIFFLAAFFFLDSLDL